MFDTIHHVAHHFSLLLLPFSFLSLFDSRARNKVDRRTFIYISSTREMATFKPRVSLDVSPPDALTLKDGNFYSLVERLTSSDIVLILEGQRINSINTFLLCKNIPEGILLPTSTFDALRQHICVKLDQDNNDNSHVIHVGMVGQIKYLTELFRKKHMEQAKTTSNRRSTTSSNAKPAATPTNTASTSTSPANLTEPHLSGTVHRSIFDHRSNVSASICRWTTIQRKSGASSSLHLTEGKNYTLNLSSSTDTAVIVCQCGTRLSLSRSNDGIFPLSNVYKHWKSSKRCDILTPRVSGAELSASSTPSADDPLNNDDLCAENEDENGDNDNESSQPARPNTRSSNKRWNSDSDSTIGQRSASHRQSDSAKDNYLFDRFFVFVIFLFFRSRSL